MKNLLYIFTTLLIAGFAGSCTVQKRHYMHGYHVSRVGKKMAPEKVAVKKQNTSPVHQQVQSEIEIVPGPEAEVASADNSSEIPLSLVAKQLKRQIFSLLEGDSCDVVVMKNGDEIRANILEIGVDVVKYRKCDHPDGPIYTARKSDIFMLKYKNGRKEVIEATAAPSTTQQSATRTAAPVKKRLLPAALISFLSAVVSVFVAGILFGALAVVLAIVALVKINRYPDQYKGQGFAVAGLIIGLLALILTAALLSTM